MNSSLKKSIIEIARKFKSWEKNHNLFSRKTKDGIYYWDIIRYNVYMSILSENGIFVNVKDFLDKPKERFIKRLLKVIRLLPLYFINEFRFLFVLRKKSRVAFLLNSRFLDKKGNPCDLLMEDIHNKLYNDAFVFEIFRNKNFRWDKGNIDKRYFLYKLEIGYLLGQNFTEDWSELSDLINKEFDLNLSWQRMFDTLLNNYRKEYKIFSKAFKKIKPKYLFFQTHPKGMIAAANDMGTLTLDLQHGHTNNVGVLYSYPKEVDVKHVSSIPKVFLTLGNFWNELVDFPNEKITCGNSYFYIEHDAQVKANKGVMVVSVSFTHDFLQPATAQLAKEHPDLTFYYKLHSNQKHQEESCKSFFLPFPNVKVIYTEESVKEIMEKCFAIVVIQTSVIYQALQKGLIVFIIKRDYYEVSYDVFNEKGVYLVNNESELSQKLSTIDISLDHKGSVFFEPFDPTVIEKIVK